MKKMVKCIAIDDDTVALDSISEYIKQCDGLSLAGRFADPIIALAAITEADPVDLIFMDVEMPNISGIELASLIRHKTKHLIFTTSFSKYALDAFNVSADAYLLKPFTYNSFISKISRLFTTEIENNHHALAGETESFYITLEMDDNLRIIRVPRKDFVAISGDKEIICIHSTAESIKYKSLKTKSVVQSISGYRGFIRIDDFSIISENHICSIKGASILLTNGLTLKVAKSYQYDFEAFISKNLLRTKFKALKNI
ncbi:DNA-binding response regulator [Pedobacter sp. G11]|uniref:LytR/AlgR family response regulator transcription factor n=1 Tax=Pedobacter sp. G11 TaxID=2482728 RepID=UPI000F5E3DF8|nr:response regulator [Pedobacter sp. G11]AZI24106.1 DNA-binding response regulator [Pedobacter sp. G11]